MSDFLIEGGFDDRAILEGFRRLVQVGTETGNKVGAGFEDSLNRFGKRSIASLQTELERLQSRQTRLNVDSTAFTKTADKIKEIQGLIDKANAKKLLAQVDLTSINGLQTKLQVLQQQAIKLKADSTEYKNAQLQIDSLQRKITALGTTPVPTTSLQGLTQELQRLQTRQVKLDVDSTAFVKATQNIAEVQRKIAEVERRKLLLSADPSSIVVMRARLQELQGQLERVGTKSAEFKRLTAAIRETTLELERANEPAKRFGALDPIIQGIAFSMANTLTNAITGVVQQLGKIGETVLQIDQGSAAVETLGVNSDQLKQKLLGLSIELGNNVSQADLLTASYDVASSGFADAASATQILRAGALGARGGFTDLATATDGITSVLNAYGLEADQATRLVDSFITTQNDGKITVSQFGSLIGQLAPIAASAGVGIEEMGAAISVSTSTGVKAGPAITGLRQAISSILKPSDDAANLAASLGIQFDAQALKAKGLGGFLAEVARATGGSAEQNVKLFGSVEAVTAIQPLLNDQLQKYTQFLNNQTSSAGAASAAADKAGQTIQASAERIGNALSNLASVALAGTAPVIQAALDNVAEGIGAMTNGILTFSPQFKAFLQVLGGGATFIGALTLAMNANAIATGLMTLATKGYALAQKAAAAAAILFQAILNPASLLKVAAAGVAAGLVINKIGQEFDKAANEAKKGEAALVAAGGAMPPVATDAGKVAASMGGAANAAGQVQTQVTGAAGAAGQLAGAASSAAGETKKAGDAAKGTKDAVKGAAQEADYYSKSAYEARKATEQWTPPAKEAAKATGETAAKAKEVTTAAGAATKPTAEVAKNMGNAAKPAEALAVSTGNANGKTVSLAQSSRDYAAYMASAKTFAERIASLDLGKGVGAASNAAGAVAGKMASAATEAKKFYDWLAKASGLPPSRFTGGGVEAGGRYRINDGPGGRSLGQEAFLSSTGSLSLINRPANSMWTAPSKGVVLPAAVTEHLKQRGAFEGRGGGAAMRARGAPARHRPDPAAARMELAITRLSGAVDRLERKDWSVQVRVRNESGGASFLNTLNRMG